MIISIPRERRRHETRVAATPETVKEYISLGFTVRVEKNAGKLSGFADEAYRQAGAEIIEDPTGLWQGADVIIKIWAPLPEEDSYLAPGQTIIANFQALENRERMAFFAARQTTCFALELIPRISRAQNMDILTSQSNLAGYKAVLTGVEALKKALPMMMTAAGTIPPAKVLILGAGVAGLQAIATAKRLGAQVFASDVRPGVREQVESLGGRFVEVENDETFEDTGQAGTAVDYGGNVKRHAGRRGYRRHGCGSRQQCRRFKRRTKHLHQRQNRHRRFQSCRRTSVLGQHFVCKKRF